RDLGAELVTRPASASDLRAAILRALTGAPQSATGAESTARSPASLASRPALPLGRRVLVVEDNEINQRVAVGLLKRHGIETTVAANGAAALQRLAAERFDAVLMDVQMPDMDGFEVTRRIRTSGDQATRTVPIVGMTAHALPSDRRQCLETGMDDYVSKP